MNKSIIFLLILAVQVFADGRFFRQYWAEYAPNISNMPESRWRVNDPDLSLHETFGKRNEALANGLVLLNAPEFLFDLEKAELYMEMWGGHPHTADKRVTINGKAVYALPELGTAAGHCVYHYPAIEIDPRHLVNGMNALQFSCDRGHSFWGHFIMDNVAIRTFYKTDSLLKRRPDLADFSAAVSVQPVIKNDKVALTLDCPQTFHSQIESVEFFAKYTGFDENGNLDDSDWHGYTFKKKWTHHAGQSVSAPFKVEWDTSMIPDQSKPLQFKALIQFKDGLFYETEATAGSLLIRKARVQMFYCYEAPIPFWSRAEQLRIGKMYIPIDPSTIEKAQLQIKIWDGGEGDIEEPFKINGHTISITSKKAIHDVVHTVIDVDPHHLVNSINEISLFSDTHHHGIEILRPGPCLIIRTKK